MNPIDAVAESIREQAQDLARQAVAIVRREEPQVEGSDWGRGDGGRAMSTTDPLGLVYTGRWDRREKPPCNCHRLRKSTGWGKPPALVHPRLPAGKKWGDWCECMCEVHGRPLDEDLDIVLDTEGGPVL